MGLVDYSSSDSNDSDLQPPPSKRLKDASGSANPTSADGQRNSCHTDSHDATIRSSQEGGMPPLPAAFHDLYASTVRQSVGDDPSLHQGRKRQTPHIVGNWPSHLYIEWHPSVDEHGMLVKLIQEIEKELQDQMTINEFLTSDLGAPIPLHISLSRPLSLTTAEKDGFLEKTTDAIVKSGLGPFTVKPAGLAWHRSPDSNRTFLVMRVSSNGLDGDENKRPNPELMRLLARCNTVAALHKQPTLYQQTQKDPVGNAFHISIAWSFGLPDDMLSLKTLKVFRRKEFASMRDWEIEVHGVKAKIGNVVKHIPINRSSLGGPLPTGSGAFFS